MGQAHETATASPNVLVVEDDAGVARMLRLALRSAGFAVTSAGDGAEGMRVLTDQPPQALVLDLMLPDGGSPRVLAWVRHQQAPPAWVAISALDERDAVKAFGALDGRFLRKPFDPLELARRLSTELATRRPK